ncbi:MAG: HAD family hydrolase [Paracoccaceae bacterium]
MTQAAASGAVRLRLGSEPPDLRPYRLVVFDLDGTLYHQGPVRRGMLSELLFSSATPGGPGRIGRLLILRRFRQIREDLARTAPEVFDAPLFLRLSAETGQDEALLRRVVKEWMEERPLRHLQAARVAGASDLFAALRARGTQIAIWSDYPVHDKLAALDLRADHIVAATDPDVAALKPNPAGLNWLLQHTGVAPEDALMIGDRYSHDGAAARASGVDFLLRARQGPPGILRARDFRGIAAQMRQDQS